MTTDFWMTIEPIKIEKMAFSRVNSNLKPKNLAEKIQSKIGVENLKEKFNIDKVKEKMDDPLGMKKKAKYIIGFSLGLIILISIFFLIKFL